jgi:RNA methyltransferase, TrmH family
MPRELRRYAVAAMSTIASRRHPLVARCRAIARGDRTSAGILLEGPHLVREAVNAGCTITAAAMTRPARARPEGRALEDALAQLAVPVTDVTEEVMAAMSPVKSPWGIVALAERPAHDPAAPFVRAPALVVLAVDVQDPGNVGAMIRAAEAGGATGLLACGTTADPFGWRALRGSMGSAFRLPVARVALDDALRLAGSHAVPILAAGPRAGVPFSQADLRHPVALAVGAEGSGLPEALLAQADAILTIPMSPPVESLNVAISTALLVYEARRQRGTLEHHGIRRSVL